ncbi:MAG: hypothetical protein H8M99_14985 [Gloeobacteraceae cyanobacterium ES-bin-144]|nr:hypothetical protein [Verrucomicrobiales bacterium]
MSDCYVSRQHSPPSFMRIILLLLALLVPVSAQETMIRQVFDTKTDTHVEVLALFTQPSRGGFFPVRVKISNNLDIPRSAQLDFASSANYSNQLSTKSSFSFTAPAKKTVTQDIMVPIGVPASTYDNTNISTTLSGSLGSANHSTRVETSADSPAVLLSEALFTPNASSLDAENKKKSGSSYGNANFAGKFDPKQLPSDWLAFSGYDSVLMSDNDWSNVPPGARNAIQSWMNLGGQLVIFSSSNASIATLGISKDPGFGSCLIKNIGSDHKLDPDETLNLVSKQNPVRKRVESIITDYDGTWPLQSHFGSQAFHYGIFIAVLILFAILVGPVNLFVLAKSDRRHRLFITTPIISLGASLLLIALIIFQDGFGGNGMRQILMEVRPDAGQNAAFLHQEQISRTGVLMSNSFNVDPACLLAPVPISKSRWARFTSDSNTRGSFNLQPSNGKMAATGDWFQSRSEHGHAISAVVSTRGRIERTADPLVCVSTFDFPIETLYFLNEKDQWHRAESITTGKPFNLTPIDATMAEPALAAQANAFATRNREIFARAKNRPNHFIALTDKAPGIDTLQGIKWRQTHTVITGPVTSP